MVRSQSRGLTINAVSPSSNNNSTGNDASSGALYRNSQDTQPSVGASVSALRSPRTSQPKPHTSKGRRSSVLSESSLRPHQESPFKDNRGSVGTRSFHAQGFSGHVSSYLKFEWSKQKPRKPAQQSLANHLPYQQRGGLEGSQVETMFPLSHPEEDPSRFQLTGTMLPATASMNLGLIAAGHPPAMPPEALLLNPGYSAIIEEIETTWPDTVSMGTMDSSAVDMSMSTAMSPQDSLQTSLGNSPVDTSSLVTQPYGGWEQRREREEREKREEIDKDPKLVPHQFGSPSKLNYYQRRFNVFCELPRSAFH